MAESDKDDLIRLIDDEDLKSIEIPEKLPLLPVRDVVVYADMVLPLYIGRDKSLRAIEAAMKGDQMLFLATQKDPMVEEPKPKDIYRVGTACRILRMLKLPDGHFKVLVHGLEKGRIKRYSTKKSVYHVSIDIIQDSYDEKLM